MLHPPPNYPHQNLLRAVAAQLADQEQRLAVLVMHDRNGGLDIIARLGSKWQPLPGREGIEVFHVAHPDRPGELFVTISITAPGSSYCGSRISEGRLIGVLEGDMMLGGVAMPAGTFAWVPGESPTSWSCEAGAVCVVRYHPTPPPTTGCYVH